MILSSFIDNNICPNCKKPLILYIQIGASIYLTLSSFEKNKYSFNEYMKLNDEPLISIDTKGKMSFIDNDTFIQCRDNYFYLFYMCANEIFKDYLDQNFTCYFKSTPIFELYLFKRKWIIRYVIPDPTSIIKEEIFSFRKIKDNLEKIYIFNIDYEDKRTKLFHYSKSNEDKLNKNFKPKIFEMKFDNLIKLNLDNKEELINKFDTWILLS